MKYRLYISALLCLLALNVSANESRDQFLARISSLSADAGKVLSDYDTAVNAKCGKQRDVAQLSALFDNTSIDPAFQDMLQAAHEKNTSNYSAAKNKVACNF